MIKRLFFILIFAVVGTMIFASSPLPLCYDDGSEVESCILRKSFPLFVEESVDVPTLADTLISLSHNYIGRSYRSFDKASGYTLDCSGFVAMLFRQFDIALPRTASLQYENTTPVSTDQIRPGDLVFFRDRRNRRMGHVGMVVEVDDANFRFIHSSTSRGVIIDDFNKATYFKKRFVGATRVI